MGSYPVRLFVVERNDLVHSGVRMLIQQTQCGYVSVSVRNYEDLAEMLQAWGQSYQPYQDILLLGKCPSEKHGDLLALLDDLSTLCKIPIVLMGGIQYGWLIHYLLKRPSIMGYLHKTDSLNNDLIPAVQSVLLDTPYLSHTAEQVIKDAKIAGLTNCIFGAEEIQIIRLLAQSYTHKQVASAMKIEQRRVYTVTERLRHLFGTSTTEAMMAEARSCGLC